MSQPQPGIRILKLPLKTEKERLMHRLKTGHYMGENICFVCLKVALSDSSRGILYPIATTTNP